MTKRPKIGRLLFLLLGILLVNLSYAQTHTITGKIVGKDGKALEGATVKAEGKGTSAMTKEDGSFSINAPAGTELMVSHVGYKAQKIKVSATVSVYAVSLVEDISMIDQVVVTAIGTTTKKREQGYNSTTLKYEELDISKPTVIASALAGKAAGLEVSGIGGGVNPNYRVVLRGQRSLTGNNNALIIVDNIQVPSEILTNLNPQDISDVTILNGASGTAIYGSAASNGAVVVTTKKGRPGPPQVHVANTTTFEKVAFNPKLQKDYGSGGDGYGINSDGTPVYSSIENESYGPKFDGTMRDLGVALADGTTLQAPYSYFKDRNKFWQTGLSNQTDFSMSQADDHSSLMISGQYLNTNGTVYHDHYNRAAFRINGSRTLSKQLQATYGAYYVQNRYNITSQGDALYDQFLNMPANIPITHFKDWIHNEYANPNGYYNPWYANPYFTIDNNRQNTKNDYLIANVELKFTPLEWLTFTSRTGMTYRTVSDRYMTDMFHYTDFAKASSSNSKSDIAGSYSTDNYYMNTLNSTLLGEAKKSYKNFSLYGLVGAALQQDNQSYTYASISGLVDSNLFSLSNSLNYPSTSGGIYRDRQVGLFYQAKIGYKNWLFLNTTGRNDWVSVLAPSNQSFFYPSVDASFIATDAIDGLKDVSWLDALKFRASWSKVGQVNLSNYTYGAYALQQTYSQILGYPYNGNPGYGVNSTIVAKNLRPEITKGYEGGIDFSLFQSAIDASVTYYNTHTTNQTVNTGVSNATGYTSFLTNTGETVSKGLEVKLNVTPVRSKDWTVSLNSTFTYSDNKVLSISAALSQLELAGYSNAGSYAVPHYQFPELYGTDYVRDPKGRVVVDANTGMPSVSSTLVYLGNANARKMLGLTPNIRYKQWTIEAVFEYRGGFKRYNEMGGGLDWSGMGIRTVAYNRQRFVMPNSVYLDDKGAYVENKTVTVNQGNGNGGFWTSDEERGVGSNYISNGAYWKLRQMVISYSLPQSLLKRIKTIKGGTISIQGRNLFLWLPKDNVYTDPDYSSNGTGNGIGLTSLQTPPSRFFGGTLSITF